MNNKLLSYLSFGLSIIMVVLLAMILFRFGNGVLAGNTNYDAVDVTDGYYIDGTQVIDGSGNWIGAGTFTLTGELNAGSFVYGDANGALPGISFGSDHQTSTTLTAAQVCDNSVLDIRNSTSTANTPSLIHVPTAASVFSDCLTAIGDIRDIVLYNTGATSSITLSNALAINSASTSLMYEIFASSSDVWGSNPLATSSISVGRFASVKMFRFTSSTQAWLGYLVRVLR